MERGTRAIYAAIYFLVGIAFMVVVQVWTDQVPTDPTGFSLWDLGFYIFPNDLPHWGADIAVYILFAFAIVRLALISLPDKQSPAEIGIRFLWLWGTVYYLRGCTIGVTRFPRLLPEENPMAVPDGLMLGLWGLITGDRSTQSDFMFSGHTATMTLLGHFVSYYTFRHAFSRLYWVLVLCGYWAILASRIHYTADILVAIIIATLLFYLFHVIVDPDFFTGWRSALVVSFPPDIELGLPLKIVDSNGKEYNVAQLTYHGDVLGRESITTGTGTAADNKQQQLLKSITPGRYSSEGRRSMYQFFVRLLGGN